MNLNPITLLGPRLLLGGESWAQVLQLDPSDLQCSPQKSVFQSPRGRAAGAHWLLAIGSARNKYKDPACVLIVGSNFLFHPRDENTASFFVFSVG